MYKAIFKYTLIVCAVLLIGQLDINQKQIGSYFASGLKDLTEWIGEKIAENELVAKVIHPKGLDHWFPLGDMNRKGVSLRGNRASLGPQELEDSELDDAGIEPDNEQDELSENEGEIETDDAEVMAILP